jgi:hypothetical protein
MTRRQEGRLVYEEQGGRQVNRYTWQMFFPILFAVVAFTLMSGAYVDAQTLRLRMILYATACGAYLFALRRQSRSKTALYRLTDRGVYVRQLDRPYGIDIEFWIDYEAILWAGAYTDSVSLRRAREWYAINSPNRLRREGPFGIRKTRAWKGIGLIFQEKSEVMARHLEVSSTFLLQLERQLRLVSMEH